MPTTYAIMITGIEETRPITAMASSAGIRQPMIHGRRRPKRLVVRSERAPPSGTVTSISRAPTDTASPYVVSLFVGSMVAIRNDSAVLRVSIITYMPIAAISTKAMVRRTDRWSTPAGPAVEPSGSPTRTAPVGGVAGGASIIWNLFVEGAHGSEPDADRWWIGDPDSRTTLTKWNTLVGVI